MPLQATSGAASYDAFGGGVPVVPNYIEDVFSTYLYSGSNSAQTITTNIDLSTYGGLLWLKGRNVGSPSGYGDHELFDSVNVGSTRRWLASDNSNALGTNGSIATIPFTTSGFNLDAGPEINNRDGDTNVAWTFRKQPKFFDVVTYTGNGVLSNQVAHNLGSVPGCIIWKRTDSTSDWGVWHIASGITTSKTGISLNQTSSALYTLDETAYQTSTTFQPAWVADAAGNNGNISGATYVAYLFAHNAGGFGLTGTDNVISCGSFTTDGSGSATVNLGYEPQWLLVKRTNAAQNWFLVDNMRGMSYSQALNLKPNTSDAEADFGPNVFVPTATGFVETAGLSASATYIYIAIRRGPMKVPSTGSSVFVPLSRAGTAITTSVTSIGFPPDLLLVKERNIARPPVWWDKLRGPNRYIDSSNTATESAAGSNNGVSTLNQNGATYNPDLDLAWVNDNYYSDIYINYFFRRAPSFFDEVCYTGTGVARTVTHNLGVIPQLIITKGRSSAVDWYTYSEATGNGKFLLLSSDIYEINSSIWNNTSPTSTQFTVAGANNNSGVTFVAYLFSTCAGVSKVGSYTGTGTTQTINCGFTAGARFVLIKRTDSTGDWYFWDSARGIVAGNDPYLLLNSQNSEVAGTDYVDTAASGFEISSTAPAAINANGGSFIFLAIA
jgi:hypothetical protein